MDSMLVIFKNNNELFMLKLLKIEFLNFFKTSRMDLICKINIGFGLDPNAS
jgi:hypothetical protein